MPVSDWRSNRAVRVGVATFLTALIFFSLPKNQFEQPNEGYRRDGSAQQHSDYALRGVDEGGIPVVAGNQAPPTNPKPGREEWWQEQDLKAQWNQAKWAKYAALAGFLSALVTAVGIWFVRQTLVANRATVEQAAEGNKLSRDIFVSTERPWLSVDYEPVGLSYDDNGALSIVVKFVIENVGRSPARRVDIETDVNTVALVGQDRFDIGEIERDLISRLTDRHRRWGYTIFPGQEVTQKYTLTVHAAEVARITAGTDIMSILIYGAVVYGFAFDDSEHMTTFAFSVLRRDRTDPASDSAFALSRSDGNLNADQLKFMRHFTFNEHVT